MTDKIQQARRAAFEAWFMTAHMPNAPEDLWLRIGKDGEYFVRDTWAAWNGFNAALDCVVIELPAHEDGLVKSYGPLLYRDEVVDAIESTNLGIKVK